MYLGKYRHEGYLQSWICNKDIQDYDSQLVRQYISKIISYLSVTCLILTCCGKAEGFHLHALCLAASHPDKHLGLGAGTVV